MVKRIPSFLRHVGPGVVTGAADGDPSGIAIYTQAGAQFGTSMVWTVFLSLPFMIAIQPASQRAHRARHPRGLAVLDWELSTLGHPLTDFAYHALPWCLSAEQFRGMADTHYASLGLPGELECMREYCQRLNCEPINPSHWEFYLAYSMFRLAAILQGIMKRALDGTASSAQAHETGMRTRGITEAAWRQVRAHFPVGAL